MKKLFGSDPIDLSEITALEHASPNLIVYAIPLMAIFTGLEIWASRKEKKKSYHTKEALGSLFVGLGNVALNLFFKVLLITGIVMIYNLVPWRMHLNWWTLIPCLLVYDFCSYWAHRISHFNRFFWATHVVHHTAENYNLTVSFRLSWVQHFKILFFLPLAFAGFHPIILLIVHQAGVLFQFWQHTEYIKKLHPWIEWLIVTPSNHRVHHGSDEIYIDKNFGVIFTIWDKIMGTYQKELMRPTYGITTNIKKSMNPIYLNFHEYAEMIRDVRKARTWRQKLFYVFGSPVAIEKQKRKFKLLEKRCPTFTE